MIASLFGATDASDREQRLPPGALGFIRSPALMKIRQDIQIKKYK